MIISDLVVPFIGFLTMYKCPPITLLGETGMDKID
jgi:hypothetical protein